MKRFRGINGVPVHKPLAELLKYHTDFPKLEDLPIVLPQVRTIDVDPIAKERAKQKRFDFKGGWDQRRGCPASKEVITVGNWYEVLSAGIRGPRMRMVVNVSSGAVEDQLTLEKRVKDDNGFQISEAEGVHIAFPDIWTEHDAADSKGYSEESQILIKDRQMELYGLMQKVHPDHPLDLIYFIHHPDLKKHQDTTIERLQKRTSQATQVAMILPYSFVQALHQRTTDNAKEQGDPTKLTYRYQGDTYPKYTKILNSTRTRLLFSDDFYYVAELLNLSGQYNHQTYKIPNMSVDGNRVNIFPVIHVSERSDTPF